MKQSRIIEAIKADNPFSAYKTLCEAEDSTVKKAAITDLEVDGQSIYEAASIDEAMTYLRKIGFVK